MFACVNSALMLTQIMALPRAETDMADSMASMIQKYENAMSEVQTLRVEISNLTEAMLQSGIREKHLESVHAKTKEDLLAELAKNVELRKIADMVNLGYKLARERSSTPVSRHCLHASQDLCESLPLYVTYDDPVVFVRQAAHRSFSAAPNFQEGQNGCRLLSGVNASMNHGSTKWKEIDFGDERGSPLTFKSVTDESLSDVGLIERAPGEGTRNSHMAACQNMFARSSQVLSPEDTLESAHQHAGTVYSLSPVSTHGTDADTDSSIGPEFGTEAQRMGLANRRAREDSDAAQTSQDFVVDVTSVPSVRSSSQISPQGVLGLATEGDRSEDIVIFQRATRRDGDASLWRMSATSPAENSEAFGDGARVSRQGLAVEGADLRHQQGAIAPPPPRSPETKLGSSSSTLPSLSFQVGQPCVPSAARPLMSEFPTRRAQQKGSPSPAVGSSDRSLSDSASSMCDVAVTPRTSERRDAPMDTPGRLEKSMDFSYALT